MFGKVWLEHYVQFVSEHVMSHIGPNDTKLVCKILEFGTNECILLCHYLTATLFERKGLRSVSQGTA